MNQPTLTLRQQIDVFERTMIREAMETCPNRQELAQRLGLPLTTLYRRLQKYDLLDA